LEVETITLIGQISDSTNFYSTMLIVWPIYPKSKSSQVFAIKHLYDTFKDLNFQPSTDSSTVTKFKLLT
jgi:hypothetical protein